MLKDKHIVVTGASRGIGRAIAFESARNGARVGVNFHQNRDEAQRLVDEIEQAGFLSPLLLPFDATQWDQIQAGVDLFCSTYGTLDGWVNNAAVNFSGLLPVLSEEEIRSQIDSALLGPIFCCRAVIPKMMIQKAGSIVNVGSIVTEKSFRGQSVYAAAKGGLLAFSRAMACEYGPKGIRINCVQPGPVDTQMLDITKNLAGENMLHQIPLGRYCTPNEVAELVIFLLSDRGSYMTGACLNIDGGYSLG